MSTSWIVTAQPNITGAGPRETTFTVARERSNSEHFTSSIGFFAALRMLELASDFLLSWKSRTSSLLERVGKLRKTTTVVAVLSARMVLRLLPLDASAPSPELAHARQHSPLPAKDPTRSTSHPPSSGTGWQITQNYDGGSRVVRTDGAAVIATTPDATTPKAPGMNHGVQQQVGQQHHPH
jgi:hypothetical protein